MSDITTIKLPNDETLKTRLQKKLQEYKGRVDPYVAPELRQHELFKTEVLSTLLENGEVNVQELSDKWVDNFGNSFNAHAFTDAANVINAYVTGDLDKVNGGTGLPE